MLNGRKLCIDGTCEIIDFLRPWMDREYYNFSIEPVHDDAIYVIGRMEISNNRERVRDIIEQGRATVVFANPHEGSETLRNHLRRIELDELARTGKMPIVTGGDLEDCYNYLLFDHFLPLLHDYDENLRAMARSEEIYTKSNKPYKFLFLNGRGRSHRRYMLEKFDEMGLLDQSLWTWLDVTSSSNRTFQLIRNNRNILDIPRPIKLLPQKYEAYIYKVDVEITQPYAKTELFGGEWGEIYLNADAYIDTYFSVVTETVFEYPHTFRTEKIWKPVAMGQPWIAVANRGYYRDMRDLGFRTFGHLIDESFDDISDNLERMNRIIAVVRDLCEQDLDQFITAAHDVCKYNQQHLVHMREQVRQEFPERFSQWMT